MRLTQSPPRTKTGGRVRKGAPPPNVATIDQILFVLMSNRRQWFSVVAPNQSEPWGAIATALWRRGCEVERLLGVVRVRWTHEVPDPFTLVNSIRPVYSTEKSNDV